VEAGPAPAVPLEEGAAPPAVESETNVRVLPGPGSAEASLALARQVARLVVEAKQQVQGAAREATTKAVTAEVQPLLATLQNQLGSVAQKAVQAAATSYTDQVVRQAVAKIEEARQATDKAAREQWSHEQELRFKEAQEQLAAHIAQTLEAQRAAFEKQLEGRLGPSLGKVNELDRELAASVENAEARLEQLRQKTEESIKAAGSRLQEVIEGRVEGAGARLELLEKAAQRLDDAIAGAIAQAETGWRARLEADLAAVGTRWNEMVETSLESEARQAAERLARHAQTSIQEVEQELSGRASVLRQSLEQAESTLGTLRAGLESELARLGAELEQRLAPQLDRANELLKRLAEGQGQAEGTFRAQHERLQQTTAQAESTLGALRAGFESETARVKASLQETQQAATRVEEQAARLGALSRASGEELERRLEAILATASTELNRRAESAVAGMAERLQPVVEAAGQQTVARLGGELEQRLAPQLDRANELLKKLAEGQGQAEETFRAQHERLQEGLAKAELEALSRVQRTLSRFEKEFEEAGRAATSRWLAELDEKTTDTTHTTYEALFKASQWYEKKIQTQMQSALEKGLEQAANSLRDKAGEISGLFASELNHYSRSYVEHTQSQMDEAVKEAVEGVRRRLAETTETTTATFEGDIQRAAQREFERFSGSVANVSEQSTSQLEMHAAQVRSRIDAESRQFLVELRKSMTETVQQGVTQARQELEAQLAPMKEAWRTEREAQEQKMQMNVARLGEESLEAYKQRLENASNSWLVATVTTLTRQSQDAIGTLAESAERRLRDTCSQVFADVGEALRQRLLDLSDLARRAAPPPEKK